MAGYKKILVAFDGSSSSCNALRQAIRLAENGKSWIKVLAVVPDYQGDLEMVAVSDVHASMEKQGREIIAIAEGIAKEEGAHILKDIAQGEPYERIVHVAEREKCDCIVMGRKGLHGLERTLMGSVTARVIGYTDKDVLVIPEGTAIAWGHMLLATDGSDSSKGATVRAIDLATGYAGKLTAVYALDINDEFLANAPEFVASMTEAARSFLDEVVVQASAAGVKAEFVVREGEPHQVITELAAASGVALIVAGTHGRRGIRRLLMGSVTERIIGYATCPVLVSHNR